MIPPYARTADWPRLVSNAVKTLERRLTAATDYTTLGDYADDVAAAAGGVAVGSLYRTGSAVKVRVS